MRTKTLRSALWAAAITCLAAGQATAEVPDDIYQSLLKIGQIVDPACTAKLYRPLMPAADYNAWWPQGAAAPDASKAKLYPGVSIVRDQKFGPHDKDLVDIFTPDGGAKDLPVFIWVPGGGGNKIEQQVRESNAFYDNIGRWGTKNGFVVVTVQRHRGTNWDDGGRDIAAAVDWVKANIGRYGGDGSRIVMAAHSAGTGPTGVYVGHPERWPNGVQIKGMVYMSGGPIPTILGAQGGGRGNAAQPGANRPGQACGITAGMASADGAIMGPSGQEPPPPGAPAGPGRGQETLTPEQRAERDNLPGFKATPVRLMLVRAELDPNVQGDMTAADKAVHDVLCATEGANAKDGQGRCPAMLFARRHSHMGEVFSFDTADTSVSGPILAFARDAVR